MLGYYIFYALEGLVAYFISNPIFGVFNTVFGVTSFPIIVGVLIYRYRRLLNPKEQAAIKWLILSFSIFIPYVILLQVLQAVVPANSFLLTFVTFGGFFGCGINIAGFLMAVLYSNAFDIDIFVRRTLIYTLLTASLVLTYLGLVFGSQFVLSSFSRVQAAQSPLIIVASTLVVAALFAPLRRSIQTLIDRRFYRQKYDARRAIEHFSSRLQGSADLADISEQLLAVVKDTMQPDQVSLWLRTPPTAQNSSLLGKEPE